MPRIGQLGRSELLFVLPAFTSRRLFGAISFMPQEERDGFLKSLVLGHHGLGHPGDLIGERDGGDLRCGAAPHSTNWRRSVSIETTSKLIV
jgi:hypothetical protein